MAPAGLPREIVDRLNKEVNEILAMPEIRKRLTDLGADTNIGTPEDFGKFIAAEIERYGDIVKASGAKVD
jgi:tripartite-type tricarboxylate transporter receptor subunit TctC